MPFNSSIRSTLLIGSGPIVIGQACEFDYSGSQAATSLREENITVTLINSNPATIMTDKIMADNIYLLPLEPDSIIKILEEQPHIDTVLPTMGGQTALNLCIKCKELGIWEKYGVSIIGVDIEAIHITEDRSRFRELMESIGISQAPSKVAKSFLEGKEIAQQMGFPLIIRSSFTLGGDGASFVKDKDSFEEALKRGLHLSPIHEVIIDKALQGWKEFELELLRDNKDNIAIICTIENFDAMGIHTGDSITVAPSMTLSDKTFQRMRDMAIKMMRSIGTFAGGCNVQFAVSPDEKEDIFAIEINPRVSRSSALASKATGYPIARVASKLAIGYSLDELKNQITGTTSAFFEPALDYVIVKIPRWNFEKFEGCDDKLGPQMKSVGEVMGIGRTFSEALQKACQSLEIRRNGIGADGREETDISKILYQLENPTWNRLFYIYDAFKLGVSMDTIYNKTHIDKWFLHQIFKLVEFEKAFKNIPLDQMTHEAMLQAKMRGYTDRQLGHLLQKLESEVYQKRKDLGVERVYKIVDTCAAEFDAKTPYYYSSFEFEGENESIPSKNKKKVVVLGSGPNRIGQGIEFDYGCVHGLLAAKALGYETIMINCNPETVSTDFNIADKLYFEPVYWEHIYDIILHEKADGVIVQLGGQTALKLAEKLTKKGIKIFGTPFDALHLAEDRTEFSKLLNAMDIEYPKYGTIQDVNEGISLSKSIGFPLLVRPSYVLGGQKMKIVTNEEELEKHIVNILQDFPENNIVLDNFLDGAVELESDAICDGKDVHIIGIMQHIEPAGIHSGDSYAVLPPFDIDEKIIKDIENITLKLAVALGTVGLINIQFAVKNGTVYVIEANPRASRTVPFICKAYREPYINYATQIMLGEKTLKDFDFKPFKSGYAIKIPVFSFGKFPNVNKELGPEMKSTGESIYFIEDTKDPFFRDIYTKRNVYLSK